MDKIKGSRVKSFIFVALVNNLKFLVVSIPMQDKRQSKKEGFDSYKRETRALFPIRKYH